MSNKQFEAYRVLFPEVFTEDYEYEMKVLENMTSSKSYGGALSPRTRDTPKNKAELTWLYILSNESLKEVRYRTHHHSYKALRASSLTTQIKYGIEVTYKNFKGWTNLIKTRLDDVLDYDDTEGFLHDDYNDEYLTVIDYYNANWEVVEHNTDTLALMLDILKLVLLYTDEDLKVLDDSFMMLREYIY